MANVKSCDDKNKWPKNLSKRGDSWILDFYFRGQRYTENLGPVSKTIAKETRNRRKTQAADGELQVGPKIDDVPFEKACEVFLEWYKANRGAYTYLKYASPASKALKRSFDGKRLSQISAFSIEAHKLARKRGPDLEHPDRKAVTDTTINHDLTFLRHLFNKSIKWKFATVNPMDEVGLFKVNNGRTRHLSAEEAGRLLSACAADLRLLVLTAMHTGFRKKEICSLKWWAVDLANNAITVESAYGKNGDARTVPLSSDLAAGLRKLHEARRPKQEENVFLYEGRPWTAWRKSFNSALKRAGIVAFRWHDLRHCYGSWLAQADVNDKARMELMGHRDPKMTMRYTHFSEGYKRQAVGKLPMFGGDLLNSKSQQISQQDSVTMKRAARK